MSEIKRRSKTASKPNHKKNRIRSAVGVRELRANLPRYLKWVSNGNSITVMKGDNPIGRLVPPLLASVDPWAELEEVGLLSIALAPKPSLPSPVQAPEGILISSAVEESREDRF